MTELKTYSEMIQFGSFEDRYEYLRLGGRVGRETFGYDRYLNQSFYRSSEWRRIRNHVIARDGGCDLGIEDRLIDGKLLIHHMNPVTKNDVMNDFDSKILDPEFLVLVSHGTHNAIHYGDSSLLAVTPKDREPNDTIPWK